MQCRQNRKAEALCLKPPSKELAGLSAEMTVIVPRKCCVAPLITKGTPFSCNVQCTCMCICTMYNVHVCVYVQCICTCMCICTMYMYMYFTLAVLINHEHDMYIVHILCTSETLYFLCIQTIPIQACVYPPQLAQASDQCQTQRQ